MLKWVAHHHMQNVGATFHKNRTPRNTGGCSFMWCHCNADRARAVISTFEMDWDVGQRYVFQSRTGSAGHLAFTSYPTLLRSNESFNPEREADAVATNRY